jgi:hypothetical protein
MPTLFERVAARIAFVHARRTYRRFLESLRCVDTVQQRVLKRVLGLTRGSDFGRRHGLASVRSLSELQRAVPLTRYEDLRPYVDRLCQGDASALFSPGQRLLMFATSSGTTARPKLIPVTPEFVRDYRRGWNTFGLKMLSDHPAAVMRAILQSSSRHDESHTPAGVPCGAITGLMARMQKGIVRRFYVGSPDIARIGDPRARYYALMRHGIVRDVAFAITANPATLIRMAQIADDERETLMRDVHDGTLSPELIGDEALRKRLEAGLKPNPARAAELAALVSRQGQLRPCDYWRLELLACWTGGSMGHYLPRLESWYGKLPVRDVGLLASEGRISIPLEDDAAAGVLDVQSAVFEFIPVEQWEEPAPEALPVRELETGRDYAIVLSNAAGLIRYRLDDVVRVRGWVEQAPVVEFLYRAGRIASVAGEKLTENQVVAAVRAVSQEVGLSGLEFVMAPRWADPPYYCLTCGGASPAGLAEALDEALAEQNDEYRSRRKSLRLGPLQIRSVAPELVARMDRELLAARGATAEQYKRPCLFTQPGEDDQALGLATEDSVKRA